MTLIVDEVSILLTGNYYRISGVIPRIAMLASANTNIMVNVNKMVTFSRGFDEFVGLLSLHSNGSSTKSDNQENCHTSGS